MNINNFPKDNTVKLKDRILLSPVTKYVLSSLIIGIVLATGVYVVMLLVLNKTDDGWPASCDIKPSYQVKCLAGQKSDYKACLAIGCCWSDKTSSCFHSLPSKHGYYYDPISRTNTQDDLLLRPRREFSPMGRKNLESLYFHTAAINSHYLQINLRSKKSQTSFHNISNTDLYGLSVQVNSPAFSITILRHRFNSTEIKLLTTSLGPLIVTENYWEWTIHLINITLYGLESTFINGTTHWLYNNAQSSKVPAFFGITLDGEAFACYVLYSGPMEIQVMDGSNLIIFKGMSLPDEISLRVFASSTPQQTVEALFNSMKDDGLIMKMNTTENLPIIAASLGLHVCPERKYIEGSIIDSIKATIESTKKEQVPWDSHCIYRQFYPTLDTTLNESEIELLNESHQIIEESGRFVVPHLTPMILAKNNLLLSKLENASLILRKSLVTYIGSWGGTKVAYPEWSDNRIHKEFKNYISHYSDIFGTSKLIFIRDAWPRDDLNNNSFDFTRFDYMPQELRRLMSKGTIPFELTSMAVTSHYTMHNDFAKAFHAFVQQYANPLAVRDTLFDNIDDIDDNDNDVTNIFGWSTLQETINRAIGSGLVGQLPPAIYVCGILPNMTNDLCTRWYGAAVVFPYIVVIPEYLPGGAWMVPGSSKYANKLLKLRASLIIYQYTTMEKYYNLGQPVLSPTHFHYPLDQHNSLINNVDQFFWGSSLLVGIVTLPNTKQLNIHIPGNLSWRHLEGGAEVRPTSGTEGISIPATEGEIVILVRPGHVIPMYENAFGTSAKVVQSGLELLVNFACQEENMNCLAKGKIGFGNETFLRIIVNDTFVTLQNILDIKSRACLSLWHKSNLITSLTVLGDKLRYRIALDLDLCIINNDVIEKKLDPALGE